MSTAQEKDAVFLPAPDARALYTTALYPNLAHTLAAPLLQQALYPWQALAGLADFVAALGAQLEAAGRCRQISAQVWVSPQADIAPTACLQGPCIIGAGTQVRHGAFVRGGVLVGEGAVVGNSTELKNAILFDGVQVPHFNYVGDAILGFRSHLGAGAVVSNVKSDYSAVRIHCAGGDIDTGLHKLGALLADHVEVGCNSVLTPGSVLAQGASVYPLCRVRGYVPAGHILKGERGLFPRTAQEG